MNLLHKIVKGAGMMDLMVLKFISLLVFSSGTILSPAGSVSMPYTNAESMVQNLTEAAAPDAYARQEEQFVNTITYEIKENGNSKGTFEVDLNQITDVHTFTVDDVKVEILQYFPDFYMNDRQEPASKTNYPFNPAFIALISGPDHEETILTGVELEINPEDGSIYEMELVDFTLTNGMEI